MTEIREYPFYNMDYEFMKRFKQWDYLWHRIQTQMPNILPWNIHLESSSMIEGDLNIEKLIEIQSSPVKDNLIELLDMFIPIRRSAKIIFGLDTSGSTEKQ